MKIECVCVSTNHDDFLDVVIPLNKNHFDNYIIVTKEEDKKTIAICEKYNITCNLSNLFHKNRAKFNRGAVYNETFTQLQYNDWVVLIDSDIVLVNNFRSYFEYMNSECFFGARRRDVPTKKIFNRCLKDPKLLDNQVLFRGFGYGFLQIFNYQSFVFQRSLPFAYPETFDSGECDWQFRNKWGDIVYNPDFNINEHQEKNVNDFSTGLLRELPCSVLHLGIPGFNSAERKTEKFV